MIFIELMHCNQPNTLLLTCPHPQGNVDMLLVALDTAAAFFYPKQHRATLPRFSSVRCLSRVTVAPPCFVEVHSNVRGTSGQPDNTCTQ